MNYDIEFLKREALQKETFQKLPDIKATRSNSKKGPPSIISKALRVIRAIRIMKSKTNDSEQASESSQSQEVPNNIPLKVYPLEAGGYTASFEYVTGFDISQIGPIKDNKVKVTMADIDRIEQEVKDKQSCIMKLAKDGILKKGSKKDMQFVRLQEVKELVTTLRNYLDITPVIYIGYT